MPDTHHLPPLQDIMTNARMRAAAVGDLAQTFHRFDAERFHWLAQQLLEADRPEAAKLAFGWMREHLETAEKLEAAP